MRETKYTLFKPSFMISQVDFPEALRHDVPIINVRSAFVQVGVSRSDRPVM